MLGLWGKKNPKYFFFCMLQDHKGLLGTVLNFFLVIKGREGGGEGGAESYFGFLQCYCSAFELIFLGKETKLSCFDI